MCLSVCQQHRERESLGARAGYVVPLPLSLSLSPFHYAWKVVKDRVQAQGSKLIIQCSGNVSKASTGRLETSKGLFHWKLLNIPELMK